VETPAAPPGHPLHPDRPTARACDDDAACVISGDRGDVCAPRATPGNGEVAPASRDARCGCVGGLCSWYRVVGTSRERLPAR
jgi:hypothetical protein